MPDPVVQERIEGREFTAECLVGRDFQASVILRWQLVVKGGLAMVSRTFHHFEGQRESRPGATGLVGACRVRGFLCTGGPHRS